MGTLTRDSVLALPMAEAPSSRQRTRGCSRAALLLALLAAPATAQYRAAGSDLEIVPNRKKQLEDAMKEARWHLGEVRIAPWIGLRDLNYVRELDPQGRQRPADFTITAGAGLKAYLKMGEHAIAAAHVLPEYVWWQRDSSRNTAVGHYGLGLFGWGNRLQGELTARRSEEVGFLGSDLLTRAPTRSDALAAGAQLRLFGSIAVYGGGSTSRIRVEVPRGLTAVDPALLLDRDTSQYRGGLRYLLRGDRGYLGAGAFAERTEFHEAAADTQRSNKGSGWYAESELQGNNLDLSLRYDQRDLEADTSAFPGYRAGNGQASLLFHPGWRLQYQLYGLRQLRYSALAFGSFLEEERTGASIVCLVGPGSLRLFYERGADDYFGLTTRHERVTGRGGWIDVGGKRAKLRLGGRQTTFEPDPGQGPVREVKELLGALSLTFGSPGEW